MTIGSQGWSLNGGEINVLEFALYQNRKGYIQMFSDKRNLSDSPSGSVSKNPPAMEEIQVWSLDQEDPLEKQMATHSSILA